MRKLTIAELNFNPRSHERSDSVSPLNVNKFEYFNPRSHERSDDTAPEGIRQYSISIHAPTRGATEQRRKLKSWFEFQSTLPREERRLSASVLSYSLIFQSTLPREERQSQVFCCFLDNYFNPRSHERSDADNLDNGKIVNAISIHAPTRGATKSEK